MIRIPAHRAGQRQSGPLGRTPRQCRGDCLRQRGGAIAEDRRRDDGTASGGADQWDHDRRPDARARAEHDRAGADQCDGENAEHAVHEDGRRRFGEPDVMTGQAVGAIGIAADAREKRAHEGAHEERAEDCREVGTRSRRQRAEEVHPSPRHQCAIDQHQEHSRQDPPQVCLGCRAEDGPRVCVPDDDCRQGDGDDDAKDAEWTQALYLAAGKVSRCRSGWRLTW